ncbi:MAG: AAA domain-containing protein, partial [Terriglobia bacterium]
MIEGREGGESNAIANLGGPPEYAIDEHKERDLPLIYDADSSQHSALIDALEGRSIVIKGPPGTGKSQTITNLIANTITQGRKVLFVSEKMAALNVVKNRLTHAGLGDFCLELHSNKTQKKTVLDALDNRLGGTYQVPPGLSGQLRALEEKRDALKTYVEIMKSRVGNAQELTVHEVFWKAERARQQCGSDWKASLDISVPRAQEMVLAAQESMRSLLSQVAQQYLRIADCGSTHPFWGFYPLQFTPSTERTIETALKEYFSTLEELAKRQMQAASHFGTSELELDAERARALEGVLNAIQNASTVEPAYELLNVLFGPDEHRSLRCTQVLKGFSEKLAKVALLRQKVQGKLSEQAKASP